MPILSIRRTQKGKILAEKKPSSETSNPKRTEVKLGDEILNLDIIKNLKVADKQIEILIPDDTKPEEELDFIKTALESKISLQNANLKATRTLQRTKYQNHKKYSCLTNTAICLALTAVAIGVFIKTGVIEFDYKAESLPSISLNPQPIISLLNTVTSHMSAFIDNPMSTVNAIGSSVGSGAHYIAESLKPMASSCMTQLTNVGNAVYSALPIDNNGKLTINFSGMLTAAANFASKIGNNTANALGIG